MLAQLHSLSLARGHSFTTELLVVSVSAILGPTIETRMSLETKLRLSVLLLVASIGSTNQWLGTHSR